MFTTDYELLEEVGRGRFGIVSKCKSRSTGEIFAVKTIDKSLLTGDITDKQSLINEPKALQRLSLSSTSASSYITRLHATYDTPSHLHLILDFFPFPSLYDVVTQNQIVHEHEIKSVTFSLLQGILHCHQNGIIHRDIKIENVLCDPITKRVKICDFGSCGFTNEHLMDEVVGTPYYVAPEILEGKSYDEKVDAWSVGVVLYVMIAGIPPFYAETVQEIFEKIVRANLRLPTRVFGSFSSNAKDLLRRLICKDVSRRLSVQEALSGQESENSEKVECSVMMMWINN